mgnify:CR=1 FL=1
MSIYFTLEYDENGVSRIVEKKDTSTRAINKRDFKFGTYTGNQITSPEDPNQPGEGNNTGDFISQMGTGTMGGNEMTSFERFIDRSGLTPYLNEGKGPKDTKFINAAMAAMGIPFTAEGFTRFLDGISKFLPQDSPEVKAIKKFYSTKGPEGGLDYMNPNSEKYIPGMENYNIVYGGFPFIKDADTGLQEAFQDRMDTIQNTLMSDSYMRKYGAKALDAEDIQAIIDGTYIGPETPLTKRYKNLYDVSSAEGKAMEEFFNKKDKKDKDDNEIDVTAPGAGTVITPDTDDDPAPGPSGFDPGEGFVDQGGYGEFGPPPKNDDKPKDDNKGSGGSGGSGGFGGADFGNRSDDKYGAL